MFRSANQSVIAGVLMLVTGAAVAETLSLTAAVSWSGHGQVLKINTTETEFLGVINGIMYVERASGELDEGFMECTVKQILDVDSGSTAAEGNCVIIQSGDDNVFAEYSCTGQVGICRGSFTLLGGTGRFSGIEGQSPMVVRSPLRHLSDDTTDVENLVINNGVLLLTDLKVTAQGNP